MIGNLIAGISVTPLVLGDYESIATVTVTGATAADIEFTSIPSTFQHLQIRGISRTDGAGNNYSMIIASNNNTTSANYRSHVLYGDGSSAVASTNSGIAGVYNIGVIAGAGAGANVFAVQVIDVLDYQSTNKNKTFRYLGGQDRNGAGLAAFGSGVWLNSANAITSLKLSVNGGNFVQHSSFALYGIKG